MSDRHDQDDAGRPGDPLRPRRPSSRKRPSSTGSHKVGYGKPPEEHQFQPGRSGNPKGRPVGSKNKPPAMPPSIKDIILQEAYRPVSIRDGDEQISMPIVQASLRAMAIKAVQGNTRAQWQLSRLTQMAEEQHEREQLQRIKDLIESKMIGEREIARRKARGNTDTSDIIPHPDHIHIDVRTMTGEIRGPLSAEERESWLEYRAFHAQRAQCIAVAYEDVATETDPAARARVQAFLAELEAEIAEEEARVSDWWHITE